MRSLNAIFELLLFPFIVVGHFFSSAGNVVNIGDYKGSDSASAWKINLFLLFFLIFSSIHLYAAAPTNTYVPSIGTDINLTSSGYTDTIHEASRNDYVYYKFKAGEAGDITITVNDTFPSDDAKFNYNTSGYPSPDWNAGVTTQTFFGKAQNDTIYIAISYSSGTPAKHPYQIVVTLTPTSTSSDSNLTITKTNSADIVTFNENFYYTINVKNIGIDMASSITVTDILPSDMDFNSTATNDSSPYNSIQLMKYRPEKM